MEDADLTREAKFLATLLRDDQPRIDRFVTAFLEGRLQGIRDGAAMSTLGPNTFERLVAATRHEAGYPPVQQTKEMSITEPARLVIGGFTYEKAVARHTAVEVPATAWEVSEIPPLHFIHVAPSEEMETDGTR
jgi:hypothetical protein